VPRSIVLQVGLTFALGLLALSLLVVGALRRPVHLGREGLIGERGVALSPLDPDGRVRVHGEQWSARVDGPTIEVGTAIEVVAVEGLVLTVRRAGGDARKE
jgi:membrane-bound serine protease (ClpP class)